MLKYSEIRRDEYGILVEEGGTLEGYWYGGREISIDPNGHREGEHGYVLVRGRWEKPWDCAGEWWPGDYFSNLLEAINWIDAESEKRRAR